MSKINLHILWVLACALSLGGGIHVAHAEENPRFCSIFVRELEQGNEGEDVRELQKVLDTRGYGPVPASGYFGPLTAEAVRRFQRAHGIPQTGSIGPITFKTMRARWCAETAAPTSAGEPALFLHRSEITPGTPSPYYLYWVSRGMTSCTLDGRTVPTSAIERAAMAAPHMHTLTCEGSGTTLTRTIAAPTASTQPTVPPTTPPATPETKSEIVSYVGSAQGTTGTLTWRTTGMTSCRLVGGGIDATVTTSGSRAVEIPDGGASFSLSCVGQEGQTHVKSVTLHRAAGDSPGTVSVDLQADKGTVSAGGTVILSWVSAHVRSNEPRCELRKNGVLVGAVQTTSSNYPVTPDVSATYALTCYGLSNSATDSVQITVTAASQTETIPANTGSFFTADKTSIVLGETVTVRWGSPEGTTYCTVPLPQQTQPTRLEPSGTRVVTPARVPKSTFTLRCFSAVGAQTYTADLSILVSGGTATFTSNFTSVPVGYSVTLSWNVPMATSCSIAAKALTASHTWILFDKAASSGSTSAMVSMPTQFVLSCVNAVGDAFISRTVDVSVEYQQP